MLQANLSRHFSVVSDGTPIKNVRTWKIGLIWLAIHVPFEVVWLELNEN